MPSTAPPSKSVGRSKRIVPSAESSTGAKKNSPPGMFTLPVVHFAVAVRERERQVGVLADDAHLVRRVEPLEQPAHPLALGVPVAQHAPKKKSSNSASVIPASWASAFVGNWQLTQGISCRHRAPEERRLTPFLTSARRSGDNAADAARVLRRLDRDPRVHVLAREPVDLRELADELGRRLAAQGSSSARASS